MGVVTHGKSGTSIYWTWSNMIERCSRVTHKDYCNYGARGIYVCERWKKFENFYADMGDRPEGLSLDRIDNDGPYSPENCQWTTPSQQTINSSRAHKVTFQGETLALCEWDKRLGIPAKTIERRLREGWSVERALTTPNRAPKPNRVILTHNGETHPVEVWAERCGLRPSGLRKRLARGWSVERAVTLAPQWTLGNTARKSA